MFDCVEAKENEWRKKKCPVNFAQSNCDRKCQECEGAWNCGDLTKASEDIIKHLDTNGDKKISMTDNIDKSHLAIVTEICDYTNDKEVTPCEIFDCLVKVENMWRDKFCPEGY